MTSASYYYRGDANNVVSNNLVKNLYIPISKKVALVMHVSKTAVHHAL